MPFHHHPTPVPAEGTCFESVTLSVDWSAGTSHAIISSLEMPFALLFSPVLPDKLCHNRKISVKFSKELCAVSRLWDYNYACVIKAERLFPANCQHPCLHHKKTAGCTQEGSSQSHPEGCLDWLCSLNIVPGPEQREPGERTAGGEDGGLSTRQS